MTRLLIVDDDKSLLRSLSIGLKRRGYEVNTASCAKEALSKIKEYEYRAILTDIRMPEMDGIELTIRINRSNPNTVVILMSAYGDEYLKPNIQKTKVLNYITKPFSLPELVEILDKIDDNCHKDKLGTEAN